MRKIIITVLACFAIFILYAGEVEMMTIYDFDVNTIDGETVSLSQYKGKTVMIVNVASKCGFTSQYEGLQTLYDTYKDRDFVVLGFPANNFMNQEPGTNEEIKSFCSLNYGVDFPMFQKSHKKQVLPRDSRMNWNN